MKKILKNLIIIFSVIGILAIYIPRYFTFNISPSMPKGLYFLTEPSSIKLGDIVLLDIPKNQKGILYQRGYLEPKVTYLIKQIRGVKGDDIKIIDNNLNLNNICIAHIQNYDSKGRALPHLLKNEIIKEDKYLALGITDNSYDSRYFGLIDKSIIKKKCYFLFKM